MKKLLLTLILLCPLNLIAQELPSNFYFKRETGQKTGLPIFELIAHPDAMAYDAARGNTFEAVGLTVQPDRNIFGIHFMNAKTSFQLSANKDKSCTLTLNKEKFEYPRFTPITRQTLGKLKIEIVAIQITKTVFDKLIDATDVMIRCGAVRYNLDEDNLDALLYLANQMDADIERRGK